MSKNFKRFLSILGLTFALSVILLITLAGARPYDTVTGTHCALCYEERETEWLSTVGTVLTVRENVFERWQSIEPCPIYAHEDCIWDLPASVLRDFTHFTWTGLESYLIPEKMRYNCLTCGRSEIQDVYEIAPELSVYNGNIPKEHPAYMDGSFENFRDVFLPMLGYSCGGVLDNPPSFDAEAEIETEILPPSPFDTEIETVPPTTSDAGIEIIF